MIMNQNIAPELKTTLIEPLHLLERTFLKKRALIQSWFKAEWEKTRPPIYGSVDLRNAGFKLAPIDMNLFPAGFNNLNPAYLSQSISAARKSILQHAEDTKKILLIPESHTRNLFYWENMQVLLDIIHQAGFEARLGSLTTEPLEITLQNGEKIIVEPIAREHDALHLSAFVPDLILLNNDLSDGIPPILQQLKQRLIPPAELGWSQRLKSGHFQYYAAVANEFAQQMDIDPWFIAPLFRHCGEIDFMQRSGMDCLVRNAAFLFDEIKKKYEQYQIQQQPFLVIKADAGTYGMAVMTVRNIEELKTLNRKQRTHMAMTKGGQPVRRVIIQEGVYTFETIGESQFVAEPVVYLWGECVVGGFYRVHKDRGIDESLNAPGMHFEPLAFSQTCDNPCDEASLNACQNRFYTYGIIAQLSMLAAAREIKDQKKSL